MSDKLDALLLRGAARAACSARENLEKGSEEQAFDDACRAFELLGGALGLDPATVIAALETPATGRFAEDLVARLNAGTEPMLSHERDLRDPEKR